MNPTSIDKVNLAAKFATFAAPWQPRIIAALNGQEVKVVRIHGDFVWHRHDDADELFWVIEGRLRIDLEGDGAVELGPGELVVIPRGVLHRPVAADEVLCVLFEPAGTVNTGDAADDPRTFAPPQI